MPGAVVGLGLLVALYVFGALHMRLWQFVVGVAVGSAILNTIILYGIGAFIGL